MYQLLLSTQASREYERLPTEAAIFVNGAMERLRTNPYSEFLDVMKLKPPLDGYRLRAGKWRILYRIDGHLIKVYSIEDRKDAYKKRG